MDAAQVNLVTANLLSDNSLTEEDCSKVISASHLDLLAQSCCAGGVWKRLAPHLELKRAVVEDIDKMQVEDNEKRSTFFYRWNQIKGREATYMTLMRALILINRRMDAEELLKLLKTAPLSPTSIAPASFVNPDPPSLEEIDNIRQQLMDKLEDIRKKYIEFVECVRTGITEKEIPAKELTSFLLSQSVFNYDNHNYKLFSDKKDVLEAMDINQIFNLLNTEYASFLNYEIFFEIAKKYELNKGQTEEMDYPQHLQNYINKQKVSEFLIINPTLLKHCDSSETILLKFDMTPTCTLAKVKDLSKAIAYKMKWSRTAVRILDIGEGCISVTLIIPANLADYVFNRDIVFTQKQKKDLLELKVLSVKFHEKIYRLDHTAQPEKCRDHDMTDLDMPPHSSTPPDHDMTDLDMPPRSSTPPDHDMSDFDMPPRSSTPPDHDMSMPPPSSMPPDHDKPDYDMPSPTSMPQDHGTSPPSSTIPTKKSAGTDLQWTNYSGRTAIQAGGTRDVLIIVSEDVTGPDVVQRRPAIRLTKALGEKLENQGIARKHQSDDLALVKARRSLDKTYTSTVKVSDVGTKKQRVLEEIETIMKSSRNEGGVVIHYIGAGRRYTGDWCFEDGFITFKDLAHLYLQLLRGHVLSIVTDCSHSGSWIRECVTFLDEQGVKPCGHSARDKGILLSIFTSSRSHEIPRRLAFSLDGCINDQGTDTNYLFFYGEKTIADEQHSTGINFTDIRCGSKGIDEECRHIRHTTWHDWWSSTSIKK